MEKEALSFRIDTMAFLNEIVNCALRENQGVLKVPLSVFQNLLAQTAERATQLNDPQLNIIMLRLGLYEIEQKEIHKMIETQKKLIKKQNEKQ